MVVARHSHSGRKHILKEGTLPWSKKPIGVRMFSLGQQLFRKIETLPSGRSYHAASTSHLVKLQTAASPRYLSTGVSMRQDAVQSVARNDPQHAAEAAADKTWDSRFLPSTALADMDLSEQMRHVMRRVSHPVTVLTVARQREKKVLVTSKSSTRASESISMTVSSFNTVCLKPRCIVSMNIKLPSATWNAITDNKGHFVAHFLRSSTPAATLAAEFARGSEQRSATDFPLFRFESDLFPATPKPGGGSHEVNTEHALKLPGYSGYSVMAALCCRLLLNKQVIVDDHLVACAVVERISYGDGWMFPGSSLLYGNQTFGAMVPLNQVDPGSVDKEGNAGRSSIKDEEAHKR